MPELIPITKSTFRRFQPDVVGLTGFTSHVNIIKTIASRMKSMNSKILIVVGGHHATVQPKDFNDPYIDVVVIGEGVFTLREILRAWEMGGEFSAIHGVAISGMEQFLNYLFRVATKVFPCGYFPQSAKVAPPRAAQGSSYRGQRFKPFTEIMFSIGGGESPIRKRQFV